MNKQYVAYKARDSEFDRAEIQGATGDQALQLAQSYSQRLSKINAL